MLQRILISKVKRQHTKWENELFANYIVYDNGLLSRTRNDQHGFIVTCIFKTFTLLLGSVLCVYHSWVSLELRGSLYRSSVLPTHWYDI